MKRLISISLIAIFILSACLSPSTVVQVQPIMTQTEVVVLDLLANKLTNTIVFYDPNVGYFFTAWSQKIGQVGFLIPYKNIDAQTLRLQFENITLGSDFPKGNWLQIDYASLNEDIRVYFQNASQTQEFKLFVEGLVSLLTKISVGARTIYSPAIFIIPLDSNGKIQNIIPYYDAMD